MRIDRAPRLDESRSFTLWSHGRAQRARYVFLESGEAVAPWSTLAALLGMDELMLDTVLHRATPEGSSSALSFTTIAERDGDWVRCVRIDRVDAFLSHVDWLTGGEQ
jgi:hypothetical protein